MSKRRTKSRSIRKRTIKRSKSRSRSKSRTKRSRKSSQSARSYTTLDNGGRPFTVKISKNHVKVYKNLYKEKGDHSNKIGEKLVLTLVNPVKIFIGKDKTKSDIGNSILINTNGNKYVYIGESVKQFTTNDNIKKYSSPVGNSAVPYPFAVGDEFTYLMIENKKISNNEYHGKPYEAYYTNNKIGKHLPMKTLVKRTI